jgi:hypothetical protein
MNMATEFLKNQKPLKTQIDIKIKRSSRSVFLRADFEKLGGYDQIGRALRSQGYRSPRL